MRNILGFIAFILTFGFSVSMIGLLFGFPQTSNASYLTQTNRTSTTIRIERLLKRDVHRNGIQRNSVARSLRSSGYKGDLDLNAEFRRSVLNYVRESSSMSDTGLPRDFQYAWRNHMKAWNTQATYLNSFDEKVRAGKNENHSYSVRIKDNSDEINKTWDQVLRIARRYGVRIDRSYYR